MRTFVALSVVGLTLFHSSIEVAARQPPAWKCLEEPIAPCVKRRGRLSSQNGIALKIWLIGTTRMVAVANGSDAMPPVLQKYLEMTSDDHSYIFGDFDICPLTPDRPGHIRHVCVAGAERLVVQPLRRPDALFRLLSTWPADAPR